MESSEGYNLGRKNWQRFCIYEGSDVIQGNRVTDRERGGHVQKARDTNPQCSTTEKPYSFNYHISALFSAMQTNNLTF